ncbi:ABC transporter ATP-binding protein [uncultured Methanobrevibacter sp.]|uniref:oligopeptide/dipeptide ABC transporter ATP-binding protein n=1 Tax=uncultured Methanobrevibacter sp. TaxID=253161 RepID=UPI00262BA2D2|nr:ABC transporter ATP-binding protein [uncultured Methanobrevibacter sp.]
MNKLLNVKNVSISFTQYTKGLHQNNLKVINDLSLDINEGEILAVLGSSGSGKSLLAHAILGILPENANLNGEIKYDSEILTQESKERLRGNEISLIPQSVNFLDPLMKIADQAIGKNKTPEKIAKQREIFEKYGLSKEVDNMYPFQLSGGMARKVLISTALLSNPKLVIADEPTPGLDQKSVKETLKHLKELAKNNVGVLLITHDIYAALSIADKICIFYAGYVIEIVNTKDFKEGKNLLHPYTQALYDSLPQNGFKLTKGHQPSLEEIQNGCPYYDRCDSHLTQCQDQNPPLVNLKDKKVRCFKYKEEI